jgi:nucleoside-diphosphate-sugar epimerase
MSSYRGLHIHTVLGAKGFIGRHLVQALNEVIAPTRGESLSPQKSLGHVIYCIGYTSDFRQHPLETAEAHVSLLIDFLKKYQFDSFLYLSSTRVYFGAANGEESSELLVNPSRFDDIFNLTKLSGEACCLSVSNPCVRVARVSNVLGQDFQSDNFVFSLLKDAVRGGHIKLRTTPDSAKDYIAISDVVELLLNIAARGKERLYNVASGVNISNREIVAQIQELTGCRVEYADSAKRVCFPPVSIQRVQKEFGFSPKQIPKVLKGLIQDYLKLQKRK